MKNILYSIIILLISSCNEYSIIEGISYEEQKTDNSKLVAGTLESKSLGSNQIRFTAYFTKNYTIGEVTFTYTINGLGQDKVIKKTRKYYASGLQYCGEFSESSVDFTIPSAYLNSQFTISYRAENSSGTYWTGTSAVLSPGSCGGVELIYN